MPFARSYQPQEVEPRLQAFWQDAGIYHFQPERQGTVYSIDTPPPTVSGALHLGHVYSYTHPDLMARFWRMRGRNVFFPMGYDDNGLPTERLVEKRLGVRAAEVDRQAFIEKCLQASEDAERDYQALWQRLGLSVDWRYTYRTIDERSRRIAQRSFIDLVRNGLAYRQEAPAIWCPECRTAIAQADLNDLERESEFVTLMFALAPTSGPKPGEQLLIATTRPELLPACVAVFVNPADERFHGLAGREAVVPLFGQRVPVLADPGADPAKGTGAVMCCTFGDTTDVAWWRKHHLPRVEAFDRAGRMTAAAGAYAGLPLAEARKQVKADLEAAGLLLERSHTHQSVRVHERCDTPVEYITTPQWFIRVLDFKARLLEAGEAITWHPEHMRARYRAWVENLSWDWGISRQRFFGVPFPLWYCRACGEVLLADEAQLPVDPTRQGPGRACACGSRDLVPEADVFDTWATSSMSPQIVGGWLEDPARYARVWPFALRPQAHEIIRTWAFYTIVKSLYHFDCLPWKEVLISGWGIAGEGQGKISKSRGGGPMPPLEMINRYSADAVRYWAASTATGKDAIISEEKVQAGARLVTKLWNVARFCERFLEGYRPPPDPAALPLTPADRWILARAQRLVRRATAMMEAYDYASAKTEIEAFFWTELADNYLEMVKQRLYDLEHPQHEAARFSLHQVLESSLKLFAPFLPFVTEEIYRGLYASGAENVSIHRSPWPEPEPAWEDEGVEALGAVLVDLATAVRRFKSEQNRPLGSELNRLQLAVGPAAERLGAAGLEQALAEAAVDLRSITRARQVEIRPQLDPALLALRTECGIAAAVDLAAG